jgi:hypothetical protein
MYFDQNRDRRQPFGTLLAYLTLLAAAVLPGVGGSTALAQCESGWMPGSSGPLVNGSVRASVLAPNGDLVIGGTFTRTGGQLISAIARWDGHNWSPVAPQLTGTLAITSLAFAGNGDLFAGGLIRETNTSPFSIVRWNGARWNHLPIIGPGSGTTMLRLQNGDVIVAGDFTSLDGQSINRIARWNGAQWSSLETGASGPIYALAQLPSGDLIAAGSFTVIGQNGGCYVSRWNGVAWSRMVTSLGDAGAAYALLALPNGDLLVGGSFSSVSGVAARNLARYSNGAWSEFGGGTNRTVRVLHRDSDGNIVVSGEFTQAGAVTTGPVAKWNGTTWQSMSSPPGGPPATFTTLPDGRLFVGSSTTFVSPSPTDLATIWDGSSWQSFGDGLNQSVDAMTLDTNGMLIVGGTFSQSGQIPLNRIARQDGARWQALGSGIVGSKVSVLQQLPDGQILVAGAFTSAGNVVSRCIAKWNGTSWSGFDTGMEAVRGTAQVTAVAVMPTGDIIAGGNFVVAGQVAVNNIARWDGTQWNTMGGLDGPVVSMAVLPTGDLLVSGSFQNAGDEPAQRMASWNGHSWRAVAPPPSDDPVRLVTLANGDVLALPTFSTNTPAGSAVLRRMTATGWEPYAGPLAAQPRAGSSVSTARLTAAMEVPGRGLLVAGENFMIDGVPANGIALWDGASWSGLGRGLEDNNPAANPIIPGVRPATLALLPDGQIAVGGTFPMAGGGISPFFARYRFAPGAPIITQQPRATTACRNRGVTLTTAATGAPDLTFQWRKGGVPIDGTLNPTATTPTLQLSRISTADAGIYDCLVTNPATCGGLATTTVQLTVRQGCSLADIAGNPASGSDCGDGTVDGSDFIAFINSFSIADATIDPLADVAGGGTDGLDADGVIDGDDFIAFINAFAIGC